MKKITVIDIGSGNLLSIKRAFESCGATVEIVKERKKILSASKLVLPGVGAFKNAVENLKIVGLNLVFFLKLNIYFSIFTFCFAYKDFGLSDVFSFAILFSKKP